MTFLVLVALLYIVRVSESGSTKETIAAGIASGLATSTKYNAALIALPALLAIVTYPKGHHERLRSRVCRSGLYVSAMVGAFLVTSPFTLLDFREFVADVTFESRHLAEGHKVILGRGWMHHMTSSLRYGIGIPLLATGIFGMLLAIVRDRRKGALVAAFPLAYYLIVGSGYTVFARYIIPVVPFLCLTASNAVMAAAQWSAARSNLQHRATAFATVLVICLSWSSAVSVVKFNRLVSRTDSRVYARVWLEQYVPPGTTIAQLGTGGGHVLLFEGDRSEMKYVQADLSRLGARPDVVIVNRSPLSSETDLNARLVRILARDYEPVTTVHAVAVDERANIYRLAR